MSASENTVRELVAKMATAELHSDVCKCAMCMSSRIPMSERLGHEEGLKATMVDRHNPDNPEGRSLMKASTAHAIIKAGTAVDMMAAVGFTKDSLAAYKEDPVYWTEPRELTLGATWKNRQQEAATSASDASVFGNLGVLLVPPTFNLVDIPQMNARQISPLFLDRYGARLIPLDEPVNIDPVAHKELEELFLVQYDFAPEYVEEYVMHKMGGGGLFIETHPFPQLFTPLSAECSGALILGRDNGDDTFNFAAFTIPFGYTMIIAPDVIHGDSFFVGPYAIALTDTELADSVLFRQENPTRDIQRVVQTPVATVLLPRLAEYRLAKVVNHAILIDMIRHDTSQEFDLPFFMSIPADVLVRVRDVCGDAKRAYNIRQEEGRDFLALEEASDDDSLSEQQLAVVEMRRKQRYGFFQPSSPSASTIEELDEDNALSDSEERGKIPPGVASV